MWLNRCGCWHDKLLRLWLLNHLFLLLILGCFYLLRLLVHHFFAWFALFSQHFGDHDFILFWDGHMTLIVIISRVRRKFLDHWLTRWCFERVICHIMPTSTFRQIIVILFLKLFFRIAFPDLAWVNGWVFEHWAPDRSFLVFQNLPLTLLVLFILVHLFPLLELKLSLASVWDHFVWREAFWSHIAVDHVRLFANIRVKNLGILLLRLLWILKWLQILMGLGQRRQIFGLVQISQDI